MASKTQSFGFDVLLTLTAVLVFNQLLFLYSLNDGSVFLFQRRIENNQLLYLAMIYNNSLALFDSYACNGNVDSLRRFNESIVYFLDFYAGNREYLFSADGLIYSSENVGSVCLERAAPLNFEVKSSCGTVLSFEFSLYTTGEKRPC